MNFLCTEGADFSLVSTALTFGMGSGDDDTMDIMVTLLDDLLVEGTENYTLSISVSSGPASVGALGTVTVNIADDDGEHKKATQNCLIYY